jgi:flagellar biosynthetic protein FliQ
MDTQAVIEQAYQALIMAFVLSGPVLLTLLILGLAIGIFQAATSINESALAFVPKLIVLGIVVLIVGPWSLSYFIDYLQRVITAIPGAIG